MPSSGRPGLRALRANAGQVGGGDGALGPGVGEGRPQGKEERNRVDTDTPSCLAWPRSWIWKREEREGVRALDAGP